MAEFDEYRDEIDANEVPPELRDLMGLAHKWGIGDDVARSDFEDTATEEEKEQFRSKLTGRTSQITNWLNSFPEDSIHPGAFSNFTYMLEALSEMNIWPD